MSEDGPHGHERRFHGGAERLRAPERVKLLEREEEILALQGKVPMDQVATLGEKEKAVLRYVQCMCVTPLAFPAQVIEKLKEHFTERGIVIVASVPRSISGPG